MTAVDASSGGALHVMALVASAGGLEAVSTVLGGLPDDLEAAVVVLIHQHPDHENRLAELLATRATLPVHVATHGCALRPASVVVAPPGRHVLVTPGPRVATIVSGASPPNRPSADLLLTTLAIACGPRATAVVLSGGGHDGATGATAIHDFGGTVLASDEASSTNFSMPRATIERYSTIDHIVALRDIADVLASIASARELL
jgi:two-component system, chemotaxis family, protein-glutamate methylesterase/glutaminase